MRSDPLARLPTRLRLWAAAALCVLPLGLVWSSSPAFLTLGYTSYLPGHAVLGSQAPARVLLVFAAVVAAYAGSRVRTAVTKRLVRAATAAMTFALALALADRVTASVLALVLALALVAPLVLSRQASAPRRGP